MSAESTYYVPEQSKLPIFASIALFTTVTGAGMWLNGSGYGPTVFWIGAFAFAAVLYTWFATAIRENMQGLNNAQLKRSYVWGMGWFIFSEVMFFAAFFGALFYVRMYAVPWLAGEGDKESTALLWEGFEATWPLMTTPDQAVNGAEATVKGPGGIFGPWGLPLLNTIILITSSITVHFAHVGIKKGNRKSFQWWLLATVILGATFMFFQAEEYYVAYTELGLTLESGIYGSTFFLLTGFHGAHVTLGTIMLLVQLLRSYKGHFKPDDHFGFEASSWYWHFVDVVWVGLFVFVYIL
ncbi:MAG: cytochrome c oxidase subunit 3 [Gammaproteobacteria bacterium]|jgi:cytochrome c oxidase subunit 3|nr:cytochrome c oxidase subunit 3 [Gammaproteobacteria bacterium]